MGRSVMSVLSLHKTKFELPEREGDMPSAAGCDSLHQA